MRIVPILRSSKKDELGLDHGRARLNGGERLFDFCGIYEVQKLWFAGDFVDGRFLKHSPMTFVSTRSLLFQLQIHLLDRFQIHPLPRMPQVKMILQDHPAFGRAPQRLG